jgi:hypothetical protein
MHIGRQGNLKLTEGKEKVDNIKMDTLVRMGSGWN